LAKLWIRFCERFIDELDARISVLPSGRHCNCDAEQLRERTALPNRTDGALAARATDSPLERWR
jgi:hypothetical protein